MVNQVTSTSLQESYHHLMVGNMATLQVPNNVCAPFRNCCNKKNLKGLETHFDFLVNPLLLKYEINIDSRTNYGKNDERYILLQSIWTRKKTYRRSGKQVLTNFSWFKKVPNLLGSVRLAQYRSGGFQAIFRPETAVGSLVDGSYSSLLTFRN